MKLIPLSQGQCAKVDDSDYHALIKWQWTAHLRSNGKGFTAKRNTKSQGKQKTVWMSRQIMNPLDGLEVDHINRDTLDNQRANLRIVTHQKNLLNTGAHSDNRAGLKGVCAARKRWRAEIQYDGRRIRLGHFDTPELAHHAYLEAARKYHGEFAFDGRLQ